MNCKPGDLAVIVAPLHEGFDQNIGRIVEVVSYYGRGKYKSGVVRDNCWFVKGSLVTFTGANYCETSRKHGADGCIPDALLRPIRPQSDDATDEMVQLLGKPSEVTA